MVTVGIDEVGRGCWAGPIVAAAVILNDHIEGLTDSKLLTKPRRIRLAKLIKERAKDYGIGWVSAAELDQLGLTEAVRLAMQRALSKIAIKYGEVIIDGSYNFLAENQKTRTLIKADLTEPSVSAASIIAKVARDNYMSQQVTPDYGFAANVGYGTQLHREKLQLYGVSDLHRKSFAPIKAMLSVTDVN